MANMIIAGLPNFVTTPSAYTLAAASEASSGFDDQNLKNEDPSSLWRSADNSPLRSQITLTPAALYNNDPAYDIVSVLGTNLRYGTGFWRVLADDSGMPPDRIEILPNGTSDATNITSSSGSAPNYHLDVDEGCGGASDANKITPTNKAIAASFRLTFTSPGGTLRAGAFYQMFVVKATAIGSGGKLKMDLREGGSGTLGTYVEKHVLNTTGAYYYFFWNRSNLSDATGADVELFITLTPASGSGNDYIDVHVVSGLCETTTLFSGVDYDSDWLYPPVTQTSGLGYSEDLVPFTHLFHAPGSAISRKYIKILLQDDGLIDIDTMTLVPGSAPFVIDAISGYVQAGVVIVAKAFQPATNRDWGSLVGIRDMSFKGFTHGGQTYGARRARLRTMEIPLNWLTAAESQILFDLLFWRRGILGPVLISIFPNDATEGFHTTFYATLDGAENSISAPFYDNRSATLKFVEKL